MDIYLVSAALAANNDSITDNEHEAGGAPNIFFSLFLGLGTL